MAKDCNMGECRSAGVPLPPPGCRLLHAASRLRLLARVGREAVEVRLRDAAGRSRANTGRGQGTHGEKGQRRTTGEDRRNAPSAGTLITLPLG